MARAGVTMTPEIRAKMEAARAHKTETRAKRLVVGPYILFRGDEHNIIVQKGEDGDNAYFPDVPSALTSVFRRLLDPVGKSDLKAHAATIAKAEATILAALGRSAVGGLFE